MKIEVAHHTGFCMGVRRAILRIARELNQHHEVQVYGPLIHNPQTISILEARGMKTIHSLEDIDGGVTAIRTHGIPIDETRIIKGKSDRMINLTCPRVASVQSIIKKYSSRGFFTIIVGDEGHAEVIGLKSFGTSGVAVVKNISDVAAVPEADNYLVVAQTTIERELFETMIRALRDRGIVPLVEDTICDSTRNRQQYLIGRLARGDIDTLVVVGGKSSSNTKRLAAIGRERGVVTMHIETDTDLRESDFKKSRHVLVAAGASTPGWIINDVLEKLYAIRFTRATRLMSFVLWGVEFAVRSNFVISLFAFFLSLLWKITYPAIPALDRGITAALFMYSMYSVNNYFDRNMLKINNRYKYRLYTRYGLLLTSISILLLVFFLLVRSPLGITALTLYGIALLFGFFYSTPRSRKFLKSIPFQWVSRFHDTKSITHLGWLHILWVIPFIDNFPPGSCSTVVQGICIGIFSISLVFLRHYLVDMIAVQGDLIMGRESFPIMLGIKKSRLIFSAGMYLAASSIAVLSWISGNPWLLLLLLPIALYGYLYGHIEKRPYIITLKYEIITEMNLVLVMILLLFAITR